MGKRSISSPASTNSSTQEKKDAMKMNCLSPVQESTLCKLVTLSQDMASRRGFSTLELLLPFLSLSLSLSPSRRLRTGEVPVPARKLRTVAEGKLGDYANSTKASGFERLRKQTYSPPRQLIERTKQTEG